MTGEAELEFRSTDNIDIVTQDILQGILAIDPEDRLSIEGIKSHPYFKEMWVQR